MLAADCRCTNLSKGNFPTYVNRRGAIGIVGGEGGGLEIFRILIGEGGGGRVGIVGELENFPKYY